METSSTFSVLARILSTKKRLLRLTFVLLALGGILFGTSEDLAHVLFQALPGQAIMEPSLLISVLKLSGLIMLFSAVGFLFN
jgi:hypothetical protein